MRIAMLRRRMALAILLATLTISVSPARGDAAHPFTHWIDATKGPEPEMQVQAYDPDTFVVRQSIETNIEGPFVFLFFGSDRALLVDTGAGGLKIRPTIDKLIADWAKAHGKVSMPLVVAHTHAHGDHIAGDPEFTDDPNVQVVGHAPEDVAAFFKIVHWPDDIAPFDLGDRVIDIIPSPGHEKAELSLYDRRTHLLLSGDWLYPGRLYFTASNFDAFRKSVDRVAAFTKSLKVSWILGNHIEMTTRSGRDFPMHAESHPGEHVLQMPYGRLLELQAAVHRMTAGPYLDVHPDFIVYPLPGP